MRPSMTVVHRTAGAAVAQLAMLNGGPSRTATSMFVAWLSTIALVWIGDLSDTRLGMCARRSHS